ncbi:MAG: hypothetical protein R3E31_03710 [Chloroflexota bacterium]
MRVRHALIRLRRMRCITDRESAVATVRNLLSSAKVKVDDAESDLVVAAQALVKANNLVAFYGAEGGPMPKRKPLRVCWAICCC